MEISNQLKNLFNSNSDVEKYLLVSVILPKGYSKMFKANNAERNIKNISNHFEKYW